MMNGFVPDKNALGKMAVPFFEDQSEARIPGRGTEKTLSQLQGEIIELMARLGAGGVFFVPGTHPGVPKRYGFQVHFNINGIAGRIDVAALPIKTETPTKKDRALAQALFLVRSWLEAEAFSSVYRPGAVSLLPFLIGEGGQTVTEAFISSGRLALVAGGES